MIKVKQVIILRKDLNMRCGKSCAQASHASMKVILDNALKIKQNWYAPTLEWCIKSEAGEPLYEWLSGPFTKIVVYVNSEQELLDVYAQAYIDGLPCSLIQDSGFTEFHGVPTYTAVAIGPWWSKDIDEITGGLPLL